MDTFDNIALSIFLEGLSGSAVRPDFGETPRWQVRVLKFQWPCVPGEVPPPPSGDSDRSSLSITKH